ncbi:MAG TPA: peroxiredoxin-like family protein [Steroidobacteraceae bacterium]|jgi:peroxiredoxin
MYIRLRSTAYLGLILIGLVSTFARADLAPDAQSARPLHIGDRAPDFIATRVDGTAYSFSASHLKQPYILIFYRGGWCPYCNLQLADLHLVEPKLRAEGFQVLFLSTDRPALLYTSLKDQKVSYTLLSDPGLRAAQAFHIAYHLDDQRYAEQLKFGVDLEKTTGTKEHALPVPSVFIIDASGVIRFVYSNPDFRIRLRAQELWQAAAPLAPRQERTAATP